MNKVFDHVFDSIKRYIAHSTERNVAPTKQALADMKVFEEVLPEESTPDEKVIKMLDEYGSPATVSSTGGRFFGFVVGSVFPSSMAANMLAAAWDQNCGIYASSPIGVKLDELALEWLKQVLYLPMESGGALVTGTTMASFSCLAAARTSVLKRKGWDVEKQGLFNAPELKVYVGEEAHVTIFKVLSMLGLGTERLERIPSDEQGRLRPELLPHLNEPAILCAQLGNVNTGAFDNIKAICEWAKKSGTWVHVDGAFGLWANVSPEYQHLSAGVEMADSWACDLHKWLNVPYDNGAAIVKDKQALKNAMSMSAVYLMETESREPHHYSPEASRRGRGIEVWAALKSQGRSGIIKLVNRCCKHAQSFAEQLKNNGFTILNDVVLNQVMVEFGTPEQTNEIIKRVREDGTCWCGGTIWQGHTAMRISVSSYVTTDEDVKLSVDAITRIAREVLA
jgi:glutamate/tyrosine decarboxylase-like PLP-dependent enzyme